MIGQQNAQQLCDFTRQLVGVFDRKALRDGFSTDQAEADYTILPYLNDAVGDALETGFAKCYFTLTLTASVREYKLNPDVHTVLNAVWESTSEPLLQTTPATLDDTKPGWRLETASESKEFYFFGDVLGLYPAPNTTGSKVILLADTTVGELSAAADLVDKLPARYHRALCYRAASQLCLSMAKTVEDSMVAKSNRYMQEWEKQKAALQAVVQARNINPDTQMQPVETRSGGFYPARTGRH